MPTIKRYSNRKLYDVDASRYVTLDDLAEMVRRGEDVKVVDYATGSDLTALTLTQVIFDQEKRLGGLLPQAILTRLLRAGSDTLNKTIRSGVNVILDPIHQTVDEEIRRRLGLLVEDASLSAEESKWISDLLLAPRLRPTPPVVAAPEPGSQAEVEELRSQVEELEKELTKLQGNAPA